MSTIYSVSGTLSRSNNVILGESRSHLSPSAKILDHLLSKRDTGGVLSSKTRRDRSDIAINKPKRHNRGALVLIKLQESAVNFLFRWFYINNQDLSSYKDGETTKLTIDTNKNDRRKRSNARLLLSDVEAIADEGWYSLIKFIFLRWFTIANAIEFFLVCLLIWGSAEQCLLFIEEYHSYPTHIRVTKVLNDDFRADIPALTICDNNRVSLATLREKYPHLNESHYLAISQGTFRSVNDFTLNTSSIREGEEVTRELQRMRQAFSDRAMSEKDWERLMTNRTIRTLSNEERSRQSSSSSSSFSHKPPISSEIDWLKVAEYLSNGTIAGAINHLPKRDLVEKVDCANVWGKNVPCSRLERRFNIQNGMACVTLFHDSIFWDTNYPAVREVESELAKHPAKIVFGVDEPLLDGNVAPMQLSQEDLVQIDKAANAEDNSVEMNGNEMIRVKLNLRGDDYANPSAKVGAYISVHSNNYIGLINHNSDWTQVGRWHIYYIERFDYKRLPYPYKDNCYDYEQNRYVYSKRIKWENENSDLVHKLIQEQSRQLNVPNQEYARMMRLMTQGSRDCFSRCQSELSAAKCNCWSRVLPYFLDTKIDRNGSLGWCRADLIVEKMNETDLNQLEGDDVVHQICMKKVLPVCAKICLSECSFSTFDAVGQSRNWPSVEARKYLTDPLILGKLKHESECCTTLSITYARPDSSLHVTEPKCTFQDLITSISGSVEAWVGLSVAHVYLFLEEVYYIMVGAKLIRPLPSYKQSWTNLLSILTNISRFSSESDITARFEEFFVRAISALSTYRLFTLLCPDRILAKVGLR